MPTPDVQNPHHRPRRRRRIKESNKENNSESRHLPEVHQRSLKFSKDQFPQCEALNDNLYHMTIYDANALNRFQLAQRITSSLPFWTSHVSLAECVIRASQSLSRSRRASGLLLLEDHATELLNICRTCVKEAREHNDTRKISAHLYIAIHAMRAICLLLVESHKVEAALKTLYYAVRTASELCLGDADPSNCEDAATLCIAAHQAMGVLLSNYSVQQHGCKSSVVFVSNEESDNRNTQMFPVPCLERGKRSTGTMSVKQIFQIGIQSTLDLAKALSHLWIISSGRGTGKAVTARDFGCDVFELVDQTLSSNIPAFQTSTTLIRDLALPWTMFLSSVAILTVDTREDALSYSKRMHRILWDAALHLEKSTDKSTISDDNLGPGCALALRMNAIRAFLLADNEVQLWPEIQTAVKEQCFDVACMYAWKAAAIYAQQATDTHVKEDSRLAGFHTVVGNILDSLASSDSLPYVEYCAYRAFHVGIRENGDRPCHVNQCVFRHLPFKFAHGRCWPISSNTLPVHHEQAGATTLALVFLVLAVHGELDSMEDVSKRHRRFPFIDEQLFERVSESIVIRFQSVLLSKEPPPIDVLERCFKLLDILSLHRMVLRILSNESRDTPSRVELKALEVAGRVLSDCIGPLTAHLLTRTVPGKPHHWALAVECFSRAATTFDCLHLWGTGNVEPNLMINRSDEAATALFRLVSTTNAGQRPPGDCIERAAKTLATVGRRRFSRKELEYCLIPLVLSAELFSELAGSQGPNLALFHQLSTRYSQLASIFENLGMRDESCCCLVFAIVYNIRDAACNCNLVAFDESLEMLRYLGQLTNGMIEFGLAIRLRPLESRLPLIHKLVRIFGTRTASAFKPRNASSPSELSLSGITRLLRQSVCAPFSFNANRLSVAAAFEEATNTEFSLAGLLRLAFRPHGTHDSSKPIQIRILSEEMKTVAYLMVTLGGAIQQFAKSMGSMNILEKSPNACSLMEEFMRLLRLFSSLNARYFESVDMRSLMLAVAHMVASTSLISTIKHEPNLMTSSPVVIASEEVQINKTKPDNEAFLLASALRLLTKADELVASDGSHKIIEDGVWIMSVATRASMRFYVSNVSPEVSEVGSAGSGKIKVLHGCILAVERFVELKGTSFSEALDAARNCLVLILIRIRDAFYLEGDKLHAAQAGAWILRVSDTRGNGVVWHLTTAVTFLYDGGLPVLAIAFGDSLHSKRESTLLEGNHEDFHELLQMEVRATRLLLQIRRSKSTDLRHSINTAKAMLQRCAILMEAQDHGQKWQMLLRWVNGSLALAVSEGLLLASDLLGSLQYLQRSNSISREAISVMCRYPVDNGAVSGVNRDSTRMESVISTLLLRFTARQLECLQRISSTFAFIGDRRRSEAYALAAANKVIVGGLNGSGARIKLHEVASWMSGDLGSLQQSACLRLLFELKAKASSPEVISISPLYNQLVDALGGSDCGIDDGNLACQVERLWSLITVGDFVDHSFIQRVVDCDGTFSTFDKEAALVLSSAQTKKFLASICSGGQEALSITAFVPLYCRLKLHEVQHLLLDSWDVHYRRAFDLCVEVAEIDAAPTTCRVRALYFLGLLEIGAARASEELVLLWHDNGISARESVQNQRSMGEVVRPNAHVSSAKSFLQRALALAGPASELLSRDIMRSLALVTGPENHEAPGLSAAELIHSSIGSTARQAVSRIMKRNEAVDEIDLDRPSSGKVDILFGALDCGFGETDERHDAVALLFEEACTATPSGWRIMAATLCPTGEMLLTSLEQRTDCVSRMIPRTHTVCIFPDSYSDGDLFDSHLYDDMLRPLDQLIQRNENHLSGLDIAAATDNFRDESSKRDWWETRQDVDDQLGLLVEEVESKYFGAQCIRELMLGKGSNERDSWKDASCGNLASRFEDVCDIADKVRHRRVEIDDENSQDSSFSDFKSSTEDEHQKRTVSELRGKLQKLTVSALKGELDLLDVERKAFGGMRKRELIELLIEERVKVPSLKASQGGSSQASCRARTDSKSDECVVLILDEHLHRFPFEGMQLFAGKAVCRVPSLPFAIAPLLEAATRNDDTADKLYPIVDPWQASYIVDPEANLATTQHRLVPAIQNLCLDNGWDWDGTVGKTPSEAFIQTALTRTNGLLLYCGHGGGQTCFSRTQVEKLMNGTVKQGSGKREIELKRACRSSIILMGCSSGKLVSVNRKESKTFNKVNIYYEPEGIALSYLCAGSPCVVGNLWDVTDRDIDRYCMTLLEKFLGADNEGKSLAQCVAEARSSCKMKHIVGLAPVCYGVPVFLKRSRETTK